MKKSTRPRTTSEKITHLYEIKTGKKQPDEQIAFHDWYSDYVEWLKQEVLDKYESIEEYVEWLEQEVLNKYESIEEKEEEKPYAEVDLPLFESSSILNT